MGKTWCPPCLKTAKRPNGASRTRGMGRWVACSIGGRGPLPPHPLGWIEGGGREAPPAGNRLRSGIGLRAAEDVGVSERFVSERRAVLFRRRTGRIGRDARRRSVRDIVSVGVDRRAVGGIPRVVPDCHDSTPRREREVVVTEELVDQDVRARTTRVARAPTVNVTPWTHNPCGGGDVCLPDHSL